MAAKAAGDSELTELLKKELNTSKLEFMGRSGGGWISEAKTCDTDAGKVFIKINTKKGVVSIPSGGAAFVMENLDIMGSVRSKAATLGDQLARLHRHNAELAAKNTAGAQSVHKGSGARAVKEFGFPVTTCCGYIPQNNEWTSTWEEFYARKLDQQVTLIQKEYNDREAGQEWAVLQRNIPKFFTGLTIVPALLHGDLWSGNAGETADEPVIFDPASFYGHSEYEMAIATMFGVGFPQSFFDSYFKLLPKEKGFDSRLQLYQLFHYLNSWNHYGEDYKHSTMSMIRTLNKMQM
ncbi:fructosamine-3-kinase-like isoform X2 [Babylonia areolata]|uniref:fructosamine-3-kinase-like isoform X2 n=1 Tax=Babylonia areolata TaxID=304850 RepID=UPI003FD1B007